MAVANSIREALRGVWPALIAGPVALLLYAATLAPGLTWAHHGSDGGDFLAAALVGGVPHPSGYPTYEMLVRAATLLPGEPARYGNWLSAASVALGISVFAALSYQVLTGTVWRGPVALSAALCLAASPALWSQAVITEVHGLNLLLIVTLMALLWGCGRGSWRWWPALTGLTLGLSLGNHLTTLLLIPAAADWLWRTRRGKADHRQEWIMAAAATALGLAVYLYLPFAAAGDPPVNWGNPDTPRRFLDVVSGQIYRPLMFGVGLDALPGRVTAWGSELLWQFGGGPWAALIALFGLWRLDRRDHLWQRFTLLVTIAYSIYAIGYDTADSYLYLIPAWTAVAFWLAEGLSWLAQLAADTSNGRTPEGEQPRPLGRTFPGILLGLFLFSLPMASVLRHGEVMNARGDTGAQVFLDAALSEAAPDAVILVEEDARTFALWYGIYGLQRRADLTPVNLRLYAFPWYRRTLSGHHPHVLEPVDVDAMDADAFVADIASRLPVYRAGPIEVNAPDLIEEPVGVLVKMTPP